MIPEEENIPNKTKANILAFDTCFGTCSVSIIKDGKLLVEHTINEQNKQAEMLISIIDDALNSASLDISDITHIAVVKGPGSFTGIRIGLAAALGLKSALNAQIIALSSFETVWHSIGKIDAAIIFRAGKTDFYCQKFINSNPLEAIVLEEEYLEQYRQNYPVFGNSCIGKYAMPNAKDAGLLAYELIEKKTEFQGAIKPFYIKASDAYRKRGNAKIIS